jgi:hypothetical protein
MNTSHSFRNTTVAEAPGDPFLLDEDLSSGTATYMLRLAHLVLGHAYSARELIKLLLRLLTLTDRPSYNFQVRFAGYPEVAPVGSD